VDDLADEALQRLLPHLGGLIAPPERVDGSNPNHPGQTFDFAAQRPDGQYLAIEVTRAWDEDWMEAQPAWRDLAARVEATVRKQDPTITGMHAMAVSLNRHPRAKNYKVGVLAGAVAECFTAGIGRTVTVDEAVSLRYLGEQPELVVASIRGGPGEWEGGTESEARFRNALDSKLDTMRRAGDAGYQTHLVIIHWVLGTTDTWRQSLAEDPPGAPHPQNIWAVDLNVVVGTQGRQVADRIWPLPDAHPGPAQ
jgi:hypothetical protein